MMWRHCPCSGEAKYYMSGGLPISGADSCRSSVRNVSMSMLQQPRDPALHISAGWALHG